jgi:hypothetical protein
MASFEKLGRGADTMRDWRVRRPPVTILYFSRGKIANKDTTVDPTEDMDEHDIGRTMWPHGRAGAQAASDQVVTARQ